MHFRELYVGLLIDLQKITCISELILHYFGKVKRTKKDITTSKSISEIGFLSRNVPV